MRVTVYYVSIVQTGIYVRPLRICIQTVSNINMVAEFAIP